MKFSASSSGVHQGRQRRGFQTFHDLVDESTKRATGVDSSTARALYRQPARPRSSSQKRSTEGGRPMSDAGTDLRSAVQCSAVPAIRIWKFENFVLSKGGKPMNNTSVLRIPKLLSTRRQRSETFNPHSTVLISGPVEYALQYGYGNRSALMI